MKPFALAIALAASCAQQTARAQTSTDPSIALVPQVRTVPNVVYERANGWSGTLDVYAQRATAPVPAVIWIHGGGWVEGAKETAILRLVPVLEMGYSVVNVEYRLANTSLAPAAIEDCRCALRWIAAHAQTYNIDAARLIVAGDSAGGHLALMTGMLQTKDGFDRICQERDEPHAAAVVDFYGITDVAELLDGPDRKPFPESWPYAVQWIGDQPNRAAIAERASPMTYVRRGLPPIISIHGDADATVPYSQSTRLQAALETAEDAHELVTIPGGGHGNFAADQWQRAYSAVRAFLRAHDLGAR